MTARSGYRVVTPKGRVAGHARERTDSLGDRAVCHTGNREMGRRGSTGQ